jgi:hypothetical protein
MLAGDAEKCQFLVRYPKAGVHAILFPANDANTSVPLMQQFLELRIRIGRI